ncbi:CocE/NonD family hydrolase [Oerskovia enterophila]|uniref:Cocaine esterase n=1 Tax=Oerskovia enterophila TaxID=43678 RepID=A0A163RUR7_9CELL|nr:CocE/NonD family hydrolase [Oerskovia enterophila]KZM35719.1 cocaine esterase [Oerskovia enterophila]
MRYVTELPFETTVEDHWIPLADGTRLAARVWRPVDPTPVPAILEYLPYRLSDWTAPRDAQRHPYYAGHGYASVRVDIRGSGNSDGHQDDEYSPTELADGVAVVEWLAAQEWCSGKVGMFGISWGGFNALQVAALAPEALAAIVTVCSTDDRYDNDVHYTGGSVLAVDMHAWAATMLAFCSRPPDPAVVGDRWKEQWLDRLERTEPFVHTWLDHQTRDDYWRHGSVIEDYSAIKAAVLAVGGWNDPYRDTVLRLVAAGDATADGDRALGGPVRGIVGPWSHQYPDRGLPPGPSIGFLQETLRWWDQFLKDDDTGALDEPVLRAWVTESVPPATVYDEMPGRWVGEERWPSPHVRPTVLPFAGAPGGTDDVDDAAVATVLRTTAPLVTHLPARPGPASGGPAAPAVVPPSCLVASPQHTGIDAGRFFPFGNDADLPPDQREEDGRSVCFDSPPLTQRLEILGRARVRLRLSCAGDKGQVVARLCDVGPDGSSTLVTRGVLNLSAREGRDRVVPWEPGATHDVTFELSGVGYALAPGHRLRLALSSAYWPWVWPQPGGAALAVAPAGSSLELPLHDGAAPGGHPVVTFEEPEQAPPLGVVYPEDADQRPERRVVRDVAADEWLLEVDPRYGGTRIYPDGLEFTEDALERYRIGRDPLSARTRSDWSVRLRRPGATPSDLAWDASVVTRSEISCDAEFFHTDDEVVARDGEDVVFERRWRRSIRRTAG